MAEDAQRELESTWGMWAFSPVILFHQNQSSPTGESIKKKKEGEKQNKYLNVRRYEITYGLLKYILTGFYV